MHQTHPFHIVALDVFRCPTKPGGGYNWAIAGVFCVTDWVEQCPYFLRLPSFIAPWFDRLGNRGFSAGRELWLVGIIKLNYLDGCCSMAS